MGIVSRIAIVGGAPVLVAAVIAVVAWFLLEEAERIRGAAILAGSAHRTLIAATAARNDFINAPSGQRAGHAARFEDFAGAAAADLEALGLRARGAAQDDSIARASARLANYAQRMREFARLTVENDLLATGMLAQTARLTDLTDEARRRQHTANADIAAALRDAERSLRNDQRIVEATREVREALFALWVEMPARDGPAVDRDTSVRQGIARQRLADAVTELSTRLAADGQAAEAERLADLLTRYAAAEAGGGNGAVLRPLAAQIEAATFRLMKIRATGRTAVEDGMTELIGHLGDANAANDAVQKAAAEAAALGRRATAAVARGDAQAAAAVLADSEPLTEAVRTLPISPLIQADVTDATDRWRAALSLILDGLRRQAAMIAEMDGDAVTVADTAGDLDRLFRQNAARVGDLLRTILAVGATAGLVLGGGGALIVARSITRPITRLRQATVRLAADPLAGGIPEVGRRDELGDMARAIAFFSAELGRRERDLRDAKDAADAALDGLQRAKDDLVQAEKLASLGQLVAGVAHEINTPLGVALTGISHLESETERLDRDAAEGKLRRSDFTRYVENARETTRMVQANLGRAVDLVQSFKQVAVDQVSEERRSFELGGYLDEVVASLAPTWKRPGHGVQVHRDRELWLDGYPGAIAQIVTNLIVNSCLHGYGEGERGGRIDIRLSEPDPQRVELVYTDDGRGVPPENRGRIFDPFFTTRRSSGSTGLGMHIVFNLVTATLRGRIELDANEPRGVRFTIRFPARLPAEAEAGLRG